MNEIAAPELKIRDTAEQMLRTLGPARIRCTLIQPGDPVRFEGTVHGILEAWKLSEGYGGCVGIKFEKPIDPRFKLRKDQTIFFEPVLRTWIGLAESPENAPRFMVEIPGWIYNYRDYFDPDSWRKGLVWHDDPISSILHNQYDRGKEMDMLGIAISGTNIRLILFKKICNGEWSGSGHDRLSIHAVKGRALVDLMSDLLGKGEVMFTAPERAVLKRYLIQQAAFERA